MQEKNNEFLLFISDIYEIFSTIRSMTKDHLSAMITPARLEVCGMETKKYVPLEKRSKKEQRRHHTTQRSDWNGVVPVTKVNPNKKKQKSRNEWNLTRLEMV